MGAKSGRQLIGRTIVILVLIAAAAILLRGNDIAEFAVMIVLAVIVHEFGHAFQAKAAGQRILEPAVALLPLRAPGLATLGALTGAAVIFELAPITRLWLLACLLLVVAGALVSRIHPRRNPVLCKIPLGVGMHIEHTKRSFADILAGGITEAAFWLLMGVFVSPLMLWMAPLTLIVNLAPVKIGGEANDGLCALREWRAMRRGDSGVTAV